MDLINKNRTTRYLYLSIIIFMAIISIFASSFSPTVFLSSFVIGLLLAVLVVRDKVYVYPMTFAFLTLMLVIFMIFLQLNIEFIIMLFALATVLSYQLSIVIELVRNRPL
jgi:hypothetical protein